MPFIALLITFPFLIYYSSLNVDLTHDAVMFAPAGALAHGKTLFLEVYSLNGPLASWVNYPFLKIFGVNLIVSRVIGAFLFWITCILLYLILRKFLGQTLAVLVSITWLMTSAPFVTLNLDLAKLLFWSTNYGTLLLLMSYLTVLNQKSDNFISNSRITISSFIMILAVTARIEFFITWVLVTLLILIVHGKSTILFSWLKGGVIFVISYSLYLEYTNSLLAFIKSNLYYYPISAKMNLRIDNENILKSLVPVAVWVLVSVILVLIMLIYRKQNVFKGTAISIILIFTFIFTWWIYRRNLEFDYRGIQVFKWIELIMQNLPISYIALILILFPLILFQNFSSLVKNFKLIRETGQFSSSLIIIPSAISVYFFLHNPSLVYAHAFVPIVIASILNLNNFSLNKFLSLKVLKDIKRVCLTLILFSSLLFINNVANLKYSYNIDFLKGMHDTNKYNATKIENKYNLVKFTYNSGDEFSFSCTNWLLILNENDYFGKIYYSEGFKFQKSWCGIFVGKNIELN